MAVEKKKGYLVISLDLELFWGMFDKVTLKEYGERILGERTAIPRMLELFARYDIHATWAAVGMLMARGKRELISLLPPAHLQPSYEDESISAYHHLEHGPVGEDEVSDPYHFGPSLIKQILATPHQEIGNHTFSHYYCVDGKENGAHIFARDLEAHRALAKTYGIETSSLVFPRNQWSDEALRTAKTTGIRAYRGNENHFLYRARRDDEQNLFVRALRLMDHYVNLSGHHTYPLPTHQDGLPLNVPSSRFFRPYMKALALFEPMRLLRMKRAMTHAAKRGEIFHLWWHPHNVGGDQEENFKNLEAILEHFDFLRKEYGMESASMKDIARAAGG